MNSNGTLPKLMKWDHRFYLACEMVAEWSTCLSRQIGAIIVRGDTIISTGFNGPPRGIPHCVGPDCPRRMKGFLSGQGLHLCPAAHAETNAIVNAARIGVATEGATMYMSCGVPCRECMKLIINAGIAEIVCVSTELYDDMSYLLLDKSSLKMRLFTHLRKDV